MLIKQLKTFFCLFVCFDLLFPSDEIKVCDSVIIQYSLLQNNDIRLSFTPVGRCRLQLGPQDGDTYEPHTLL